MVSNARAIASALQGELDGLKARIESYRQGLVSAVSYVCMEYLTNCVWKLGHIHANHHTRLPLRLSLYPAAGHLVRTHRSRQTNPWERLRRPRYSLCRPAPDQLARDRDSCFYCARTLRCVRVILFLPDERLITTTTVLTENLLKLVVAVMQTIPSFAGRYLSGTAPYMALTRFLSVERRQPPIRERSISPAGSEATETSENDQANPTESPDTSLTHLALGCMYNLVEEDKTAGSSLSNIC